MDEGSECECSFTIEEMRSDDPRLRQLLEIPEEEKQSSFSALIQLISDQMGWRSRMLVFGISFTLPMKISIASLQSA